MITLAVSTEQINRAEKLYEFGELNGSITKGKSNIYGALGEIIVADYYDADHTSTYDYDMIIGDIKVDVKTKRTTVVPRESFFCSISAFNINQECDAYMFVRVKEDMSEAYILGYMNKNKFFREAAFKRKGDEDINGFIFKDDCYNMEIYKLNKP